MNLVNIKQEYFQKGKKEQAIECAQKLLEMELSTSKVAWITGLPLKEIRQLKRKSLVEISIELKTILTKSSYNLNELRLIYIATSVAQYFEESKNSVIRKRQRQRKNRNSEITFYGDKYHGDW